MDAGYLNQFFVAVAAKHLSAVEADASVSNQHEFNGVAALKRMFGTDAVRKVFPAKFIYVSDDDDIIEADGTLTWYDARYNHPTRTEWRLYYPNNDVTAHAQAGDTLFICLKPDSTALVIVVKKDDIIENQLFWLFDVRPDEAAYRFTANTDLTNLPADRVEFTARRILQRIGVELPQTRVEYTDMLVERFGRAFPTTREFSEFARATVTDADPIARPDDTLLRWFEREEELFMCMERYLIQERLREGFITDNAVDVDAFIQFSLSVNNRRKSRAGLSFENHLEALFNSHRIRFSHTPITENRSKPDFIFPGIELYRDLNYPAEHLTMLGAKTTAKDRWRQVLEEADRITRKHLITLEGAISENQTNEMRSRLLQLVVPAPIQATYTENQQRWLCSVEEFLSVVRDRQAFSETYRR